MSPMIVILAGGESRRMGGGKPLRELGGEALIERALRTARTWAADVRIAVRSAGQLPDARAPLVFDDPAIDGPLAGLAAALRAAEEAGHSHTLTIPCDMPFLPDDLLSRLQAAIGQAGAAVAASEGRITPVCALWRASVLDELRAYAGEGGRSLKGLAQRVGTVAVQWPEGALVNVNTPEELAAAEARLASEIQDLN